MLYNSFTPNLLNNAVQNLLRNLRSQLVISLPERLQSIKSNLLRKTYAHCLVIQVLTSLISVMCFEDL